MTTSHYYAVVMAGGGGTRLWPLSRQSRPKQMVQLGGERTLFQLAIDRLDALFDPDHIYVVTIAAQAAQLQAQCPQIPPQNFLIEPMPRGTASVVGLAAVALTRRDPQAVMAILAADHLIQNVPYLHGLLNHAFQMAQDGLLVTLGIRPTAPSTAYGYIQRGEELTQYPFPAYRVQRFREKPDADTARTFVERGDHDWNSGMFIWRADRVQQEFARHMPELKEKLDQIAQAWQTPTQESVVQSVWHTITPQTIDYGIMEKADNVAVLPAADLGWNDVGSWDSLFEVFAPDQDGNITLNAQHYGINSSNSLIVTDQTSRLVVTLGVSNLIIVDTPDAVLICDRENTQRVRDVVQWLKQQDDPRFL